MRTREQREDVGIIREFISAASFLASSSWAERTKQCLLNLKQSFDPKFL